MKTLDVCGISCPEPLIRLKEALKTEKSLVLLTDSKNALDNCMEYAVKQGFKTEVKQAGEVYEVKITKG